MHWSHWRRTVCVESPNQVAAVPIVFHQQGLCQHSLRPPSALPTAAVAAASFLQEKLRSERGAGPAHQRVPFHRGQMYAPPAVIAAQTAVA
eukprot:297846-Chlamydomonas_euryale.AAC.5